MEGHFEENKAICSVDNYSYYVYKHIKRYCRCSDK